MLAETHVRYVRSTTQIDEIAASVDGGACSVGYFCGDDLFLEGVARKHVQCFFFGDDEAFEFLFFFDDFLDFCFDWPVCWRDHGVRLVRKSLRERERVMALTHSHHVNVTYNPPP